MAQYGRIKSPSGAILDPDQVAIEVAKMLSAILANPSVRPDSDFFELGGDSLNATELMVAIEARYGLIIDPIEIFEQPKIQNFARDLVKAFASAR